MTTQGRSTRDRPAKAPLSERAVIEAGLDVLRREGLDAVTMRRVAKELDTGAASLYVYVDGRDALWRLLFDEVVGAVPIEPVEPARWREQLRGLCAATLKVLEAHPGIARVALAEPPTGPHAVAGAETMLTLLLAGGVEPQRAAWAMDAMFLLVIANAVETEVGQERESAGHGPPHAPERMRAFFGELPPDRYPNLAANAEVMTGGGTEERFAFAIDTFLDGLVRGGDAAGAN